MEEPPKIERIVSSRGISLSDTATILKAYLVNIDQHYHQPVDNNISTFEYEEEGDEDDISNNNNTDSSKTNNTTPRKSRQEREEEALIAQMDQLINNNGNNTNKSKSGMISDDVYERLKMITQSICAEVEGKPISSARDNKDEDNMVEMKEEEELNNGANDFLAELRETERLAKEEEDEGQQQQQQQPTTTPALTHRDKKREKKAKKSAKKAKKEAKRKAKEMKDIANNDAMKRVKVES